MSSLEKDWEDWKKAEADLVNPLIVEVETTLKKMDILHKIIRETISAIGAENVDFYQFEEKK